MARRVVVDRLDLIPPPQAADPKWVPPGWEEFWYDRTQDYGTGFEGYVPPWRLPKRRLYFSKAAAETWAERMRQWGCTAAVVPSRPVEWPATPGTPEDGGHGDSQ